MKHHLPFSALLLFCLFVPAHAGVLQAIVIDVQDAKTLTASAAGRNVVVILEGIDAPVGDEPFAAIARQHLADLLLNQPVAVEYTGIGMKGRFIARVYLKNTDISQQMIRDGAARYSKAFDTGLNDTERRLYIDAEEAARVERRGIWQENVLTSPGEWKRADTAEQATASKPPGPASIVPPQSSDRNHVTSRPDPVRPEGALANAGPKTGIVWPMFSPFGSQFTLRIPSGGRHFSANLPLSDGRTVSADFYIVKHPKIEYFTEWIDTPDFKQTVDKGFEEFLVYIRDALHAEGYPCEFTRNNEVSLSGYRGHQYNVHGCAYHGGMRLFHKVDGKHLKVFLVGAVSDDPNPLVDQFLNSLVVDR